MALTPAGGDLGKDGQSYVTGTCATTCTVFLIWTRRFKLAVETDNVRLKAYAKNQTAPATGDAAPSAPYAEYDAGESDTIENPQPGALPWRLAVWGAAGGETFQGWTRP